MKQTTFQQQTKKNYPSSSSYQKLKNSYQFKRATGRRYPLNTYCYSRLISELVINTLVPLKSLENKVRLSLDGLKSLYLLIKLSRVGCRDMEDNIKAIQIEKDKYSNVTAINICQKCCQEFKTKLNKYNFQYLVDFPRLKSPALQKVQSYQNVAFLYHNIPFLQIFLIFKNNPDFVLCGLPLKCMRLINYIKMDFQLLPLQVKQLKKLKDMHFKGQLSCEMVYLESVNSANITQFYYLGTSGKRSRQCALYFYLLIKVMDIKPTSCMMIYPKQTETLYEIYLNFEAMKPKPTKMPNQQIEANPAAPLTRPKGQ